MRDNLRENERIFLPIGCGIWRDDCFLIQLPDGRWLKAKCEDFIPKADFTESDFGYNNTFTSNRFVCVDWGWANRIPINSYEFEIKFEGGWTIDWEDDGDELLLADIQFVYEKCVDGYYLLKFEFRKRGDFEYRLIIGDWRDGKLYKWDFIDIIEKDECLKRAKHSPEVLKRMILNAIEDCKKSGNLNETKLKKLEKIEKEVEEIFS